MGGMGEWGTPPPKFVFVTCFAGIFLLCPPMKRNCYSGTSNFKKARIVTLPTNMSVPAIQFSQGDGNQSRPEHKKKGVLIPNSLIGLAV